MHTRLCVLIQIQHVPEIFILLVRNIHVSGIWNTGYIRSADLPKRHCPETNAGYLFLCSCNIRKRSMWLKSDVFIRLGMYIGP